MPLYEYVCEQCDHSFEKLLGFSKADLPQVCPTCGSNHAHRKLSSFAVGGGGGSERGFSPRPATSPFT